MRPPGRWLVIALALAGCGGAGSGDAGALRLDGGVDAGGDVRDAGIPSDAGARGDAGGADAGVLDAGATDELGAHRDRLIATLGEPCATWAALDPSARAVFLVITHRLLLSRMPDGSPALAHVTRVYLVRGGGSDGSECGGSENNRLFLQIDDALHAALVETWEETATPIDDGAGARYVRTRDLAGPHDPFDASVESDTGLRCAAFLIETSDSRPPTAQLHFFLDGSAAPIERGAAISLSEDPRMLEIDLDFDCLHRSNPTCGDFADRYRTHWGDYACEWVPSACTPIGTGCQRSVEG